MRCTNTSASRATARVTEDVAVVEEPLNGRALVAVRAEKRRSAVAASRQQPAGEVRVFVVQVTDEVGVEARERVGEPLWRRRGLATAGHRERMRLDLVAELLELRVLAKNGEPNVVEGGGGGKHDWASSILKSHGITPRLRTEHARFHARSGGRVTHKEKKCTTAFATASRTDGTASTSA